MSDLRPEDRLTSSKTDGLAELISGQVERWVNSRDVEYRDRWMEYKRMWKGEWSSQDRDRQSERSKAIMPAIAQAVDSAVSEVEEAVFGQERWFDVDSDDPSTKEDEGETGRMVADKLLMDLKDVKAGFSEAFLLAAVYGTGIGKVVISENDDGTLKVDLVPIEPFEFAIDPAARTIEEAEGVAHCFAIPYNVVLERQRQGIYAKVDPNIGVETGDESNLDQKVVNIIEYQGLVPASMLPDVSDRSGKLRHEDDKPVEAIVTIANGQTVLRATENPLLKKDRGFIAFPWDTMPNNFWGRGIVEKGYWPQKVLDAEVRSRIDALAYSSQPMRFVNAAMVPRNSDFSVRPGRNIFLNGNPNEAVANAQFPPPDPQTYTQGQEMQRMIEMATGQLQAATPFGSNGRNETASGMSMMLGGSIRRTRRTMANVERAFIRPFINKALDRMREFDRRYEGFPAIPFKVHGTLGMMAREFESMQLSQLLNAIPPGAPQLMLLRAVVDNTSITSKQEVMELLTLLTAEALEPQEPQPDLGGQARVMSAQTRQQEVEIEAQFRARELSLKEAEIQLLGADKQKTHEREVMRLSVDAERAESEDVARTSKAILDLAKAESEEVGNQLSELTALVQSIKEGQTAPTESGGIDLSGIHEELREQNTDDTGATEGPTDGGLNGDDIAPIEITRNSDGLVETINGRAVIRDENGLINTIQ